jgi:hypothetical protein
MNKILTALSKNPEVLRLGMTAISEASNWNTFLFNNEKEVRRLAEIAALRQLIGKLNNV